MKKEAEKELEMYVPKMVKILKVFQETADVRTFRLDCPLVHGPGQFVQLSIFGVGEAPISIASQSEDYIELTVRRLGNVTSALFNLKEGDKVGIRGPYGKGYPMHEFKSKDIIVIGGGTGVASLRGVLKYLELNKRLYGSVDVFFGFKTPADILYKKDNEKWKQLFNFHITVDSPDPSWKGSTGVITSLLNKVPLKRINSAVLTCGPPIMIKFAVEELQFMGFNDQQIWVSLERMMKCGIGKCGHCQVQEKFVCKDGPVFSYIDAKTLED